MAIFTSRLMVRWVIDFLHRLKGVLFVSVFKTTAVGLDEFNAVYDHFEATAVFAVIGFSFGLLQITNNSDPGA